MTRAKPPRQPMVPCPHCRTLNDPARGSALCRNCHMPLSGQLAPTQEVAMAELEMFDVEGSDWRFGRDDDGVPWVVASDVAKSFEYRDAEKATRMLAEDEKGTRVVGTPGGQQDLKVIFEDGLWELIFLSRKPEAKAIKKRVKAILRQIRETGSYSAVPAFPIPANYAEALEFAARQARELDTTKAKVAELEPSAQAWDTLAEATGDYCVRDAAQILNRDPNITTGQNRLFVTMSELGWLDRRGKPYQSQIDNGRLAKRTTSYTHPHKGEPVLDSQVRVTVKGLRELHKRMGGVKSLQLDHQLSLLTGGA